MTVRPHSMDERHVWSWRREGRWMLIPLALALLVRLGAVAGNEAFLDSDNALTPLMGTMIVRGGYLPLMCDGQDYLGALDAYLAAPLQALWPDAATGFALSQLAVLWVVVVLLYPLLHAVGGRAGALVGACALALGAAEQVKLTVLPPIGYLSNLVFGLAVLYAGLACRARPTAMRCAVLGLACGAGYWNNPQVAPFAGAAIIALWSRGGFVRWHDGEQRPDPGFAWWAAALPVCGAVAVGVALALPVIGPTSLPLPFGFALSLGHPHKYLPRAIAFAAAAAWLGELGLSRARTALVGRTAAFGLGAAIGLAPLVLHHVLGRTAGVSAWMQFRLDKVLPHLPAFLDESGLVVLGTPAPAYMGSYGGVHGAAQIALGSAMLAVLCAFAIAHRGALLRLLRGRPQELPLALYLALPGVLLTAICLIRGGATRRYALAFALPVAVIVAWAVGAAWSGGRRVARAAVVAVCATLVVHTALEHSHLGAWIRAREPSDARALLGRLEAAGVRAGYGQYWTAVRLTLLSGERVAVGCVYDAFHNYRRFPGHKAQADSDPRPAEVYDLATTGEDAARLRALLEGGLPDDMERAARRADVHPASILARWGTQRYVAFQRLNAVDSPRGPR